MDKLDGGISSSYYKTIGISEYQCKDEYMQQALLQLDIFERTCLLLQIEGEFSIQDIADIVEKSQDEVGEALHNARNHICQLYYSLLEQKEGQASQVDHLAKVSGEGIPSFQAEIRPRLIHLDRPLTGYGREDERLDNIIHGMPTIRPSFPLNPLLHYRKQLEDTNVGEVCFSIKELPPANITIFVSYNEKDKEYLDALKSHIAPLLWKGSITHWYDCEVSSGDFLQQGKLKRLADTASLILLLISPDFLESHPYSEKVWNHIVERCQLRGTYILPVMLRPIDWIEANIGSNAPCRGVSALSKVLPTNGKPVACWKSRDAAFFEVAEGIRRTIEDICRRQTLTNKSSYALLNQEKDKNHIQEDIGDDFYDFPVDIARGVQVSLNKVSSVYQRHEHPKPANILNTINWEELYTAIYPLVLGRVYASDFPFWYGLERDIAWDIVQDTMMNIVTRWHRGERVEVFSQTSLKRFMITTAVKYVKDFRRKDSHLIHETSACNQVETWYDHEVIDTTATEYLSRKGIFIAIASAVTDFPEKQRQALLTDLANHISFSEQSTPLREAFSQVGIDLQRYQRPLPFNSRDRVRYKALVSTAYKRLASLRSDVLFSADISNPNTNDIQKGEESIGHSAGGRQVYSIDRKGTLFPHLQYTSMNAEAILTKGDEDTALADAAPRLSYVGVESSSRFSDSASRTNLPVIWNVPYSRNPFFVGRDEILASLHHQLQAQTSMFSQPQAVCGLGGIGKTQIVVEYAYRYHQDYQAILWTSAERAESLVSSFVALAGLLHLPEQEAKGHETIVQSVKRWLETHHGWLLVLDNADDQAMLSTFLPPSLNGHVLLTTRATMTSQLARRLEIETLVPEQGALFLLRRAGLLPQDALLERVSQEERKLARQISLELGGLPLALDQAGAYLKKTGTSLNAYRQLYQEYRTNLLRQRSEIGAMHTLPVATTWSVSFQQVKEHNPAAADLLRLLAWLPPGTIAEEILPAGAAFLGPLLSPIARNAGLLNQTIEALRSYSLIRRNAKERMLSIHQLTQDMLQEQQNESERHVWIERAIHTINAAFVHTKYKAWTQYERVLPLALRAAQRIVQEQLFTEETGQLLFKTASYLQDRRRYAEAESLYQRALIICEQQMGVEHSDVATPLYGLASLYQEQSRCAEAESLYQRALRVYEQQQGPEHPDIASLLNDLASLYQEQSRYAEAEPLYQRALRICEQQLGPEHPDVTTPLYRLASLYQEQSRYAEAESLYQRALRICEQQQGPEHPDVASLLNDLASLYQEQNRYTEAEPLYQQALRIRERQLGPEHPDVAVSLNNLATLYLKQSKYAEAEPLYQRALHIQE
jgi:tetratricopeptide (TPR) repeat protein/DNA-directed RNA polymerase specialized sigma24 family protein